MRLTHLLGVVTVVLIGLLLASSVPASTAAARSAAVQTSAQALRGGTSHNEPIKFKCGDNRSVKSTRVFAVICIVEDHPDVFRAAAAVAEHYDHNFHADVYLYFTSGRAVYGGL